MNCDEIRTELGAHALGVLDPADAEVVERHVGSCARCRAELGELREAADLLVGDSSRAALAAVSAEPPLAADEALAAVATERSLERKRLMRSRAAAAGTSTALVVAVLVLGGLALRPIDRFAPTGEVIALDAVGVAPVAGTARLSSRPWGTQVDLVATALPRLSPREHYAVWLRRADGSRVAAGTFRPTATPGRALVRLAAAVPLPDVAQLGVTLEGRGPGLPVLHADVG